MKNYSLPFTLIALALFTLISFGFNSKYTKSEAVKQSTLSQNAKTTNISLPDGIYFAGEKTPVNNFYVKEALEKELTINTFFHSSSIAILKKANRWFPVIEPILKKNNIPDDFKYLAVIESGLSQVVSPAGATGIWQIMKLTARELGLEVNADIDQRYDVVLSTEAACKYLNKAYDKYNDWTLVAASYNAGMNRVDRELERQNESSFYQMVFGEETGRYVYRIIAAKIFLESPEKYGFFLQKEDLYKPYKLKKVIIDTAIHNIPNFAKSYGLSYKEFKTYNPWIRQAYLANKSRRTYSILIPE